MTLPIAEKSRKEIRQAIGYNLDGIYISEATATTGTTTSLVDNTLTGGENDHRGNEIIMISGTAGNIGKKATVVAFHPQTKTLILSPALPSAIADGDDYEMHDKYSISQINHNINQAIADASQEAIQDKEDHSLYKLAKIYEYTIPTGFVALHTVEYEYSVGVKHLLSDCED